MKRNIVKQSDIYMKLYQSKNMSIIQIYPVSEGYLRKKKKRLRGEANFQSREIFPVLETGIFRK